MVLMSLGLVLVLIALVCVVLALMGRAPLGVAVLLLVLERLLALGASSIR